MTFLLRRSLPPLLLLLGAAGCYTPPPPVDSGPRDAQTPDAPPAPDAPIDAPVVPTDSFVAECEEDADCPTATEACHVARCVDRVCVAEAEADGTACDDGSLCTTADACAAGACTGTPRPCALCDDTGSAFLTELRAESLRRPHAGLVLPGGEGHAIVGVGDGDLWLAAVDAAGVVTIDVEHGGATSDAGYATARAPSGLGRIVLGGYGQLAAGESRATVIQVDGEGAEVGAQTLFDESAGSVHGLLPQLDGSTILLANVAGRATIARLGSDGSASEAQGYFDVGWTYGRAGMVAAAGGDRVIAGDVGTTPSRSGRVIRVRDTGDVVWDRTIDVEAIRAIVALEDGGVVVAGQARTTATTGSAWAQRRDAAGEIVWDRTYGTSFNTGVTSIARVPGGFVLAASQGDDAWVIRTGEDGVMIEDATLALGGYEAATVALAADGGFVIAGTRAPPGLEVGPTHAWILRASSVSDLACGDD